MKTAARTQASAFKITPEIVAEHGLSAEEYQKILAILGREPNLTELGIFSVMWSEHCSYKSTRKWLGILPTKAPHVICGPGENAGVIDIGDGQAAIFKMESHNHPSYIEPYQGAATGVGGILRDVFTMGARPIANMNALRFGDPSHPKTKHLLAGVVAGIGGYGNCVGVPTVGGECTFHSSYNGNILVNAMTVGIAATDKIFYSAAAGVGNPVVYVGSKTGRDGIHGATMASAEFDEASEDKRPTVQVGDPFTEKLLIEACLELMATDAIVAIQDMGAAGLTSSSLEMAGKGECGIELNLDKVPMREDGMTPYEIMLSESQERMLMVLKPEKEDMARKIFEKWELSFATIGRITDTGRMVLTMHGEVYADLPVAPISTDAPVYARPYVKTEGSKDADDFTALLPEPAMLARDLNAMLATPDIASKRWIWEQYDHMVMNDTVFRPGGDAALVRVHDTKKALAITTDCTPRYCYENPYEGGKQAVAESWRNLTAVGATPLAITNCLNFGNPQKPEIMGQIVGCLEGMRDACVALDYPVISGNVSLYNETSVGDTVSAIYPTPAIGGVGIVSDVATAVNSHFTDNEQHVLLIGATKGNLGRSLYLRDVLKKETGAAPSVDLFVESEHGNFVRAAIQSGRVAACHDISDGGLLIALAEMCFAKNIGVFVEFPENIHPHAFAFGEDQARYLLAVPAEHAETLMEEARSKNIPVLELGKTEGDALVVEGLLNEKVATLKKAHERWLPEFMGS